MDSNSYTPTSVPHKSLCFSLNPRKLQFQVKTLLQSTLLLGMSKELVLSGKEYLRTLRQVPRWQLVNRERLVIVVLKGESVMTVHNLQPLTQPKPPLVRTRKEPFVHRVSRPQRAMVRRRWHETGRMGRRCLSFKVCGTLRCRI
ncbi:BnaC03g75300D [Brassica napus]|uniref:BnaC03g75300D protein n=1 Tax=Brassica napus TaxID=3708 RepID=A0A078JBC0_BRANA|nr:BnaC03g75300D [Brassica napus]